MPAPVVECVPNFSEGRDESKVKAIADAIAAVPQVSVLDLTLDPDHNRSVITFAGPPEGIVEAAVRAVGQAVATIDLTRQSGVHPRIGAADVVPFVPIRDITLQECAALATRAGERVWEELRVPVYLYEAAARRPERVNLENLRRGGFEKLQGLALTDPDRYPDIGGPALHPTAGACVIGARKLLVAFNINLNTPDVEIARAIAAKIRASNGGFPFVKALGVRLDSRNLAQVTMNLTDFEQTPVDKVFCLVRDLAASQGITIASSEVIGLISRRALVNSKDWLPTVKGFHTGLILEDRLGI